MISFVTKENVYVLYSLMFFGSNLIEFTVISGGTYEVVTVRASSEFSSVTSNVRPSYDVSMMNPSVVP
jgi:hypothetical protein